VAPCVTVLVLFAFFFAGPLGLAAWILGGAGLLALAFIAPPLAGFVICFFLWSNLSSKSLIFGAIWMAVGIAFGAWKTQGFRGNLVDFELPPEEA
jgi:hypothetical protein